MPPFDPTDPVQTALQTVQQVRANSAPSYIRPTEPMRRELTGAGLFSHAADMLRGSKQNKGTWQQYRAALLKGGVKPDELRWSGADEKFRPDQMLTREQLKRHFDTSVPKLQETMLGGNSGDPNEMTVPQYADYTLPGGRNYRELLMHLDSGPPQHEVERRARGLARKRGQDYDALGAMRAELHNRVRQEHLDRNPPYRSSHWQGVPNVVAHLRMSDRPLGPMTRLTGYSVRNRASGNRSQLFKTEDEAKTYLKALPEKIQRQLIVTPDEQPHPDRNKKALHLEELQSDWAQEGREKGFKNPRRVAELFAAKEAANQAVEDARTHLRQGMPDTDEVNRTLDPLISNYRAAQKAHFEAESGLPSGPYVDSTQKWVDLGLKRALHEAAKGGYDKLLITPGEEHAKRYDLSQRIRRIEYDPSSGHLSALPHGEGDAIQQPGVTPEQLPSHIGHELAQKLLASPVVTSPAGFKLHRLEGPDMRVGGEGMKSFYDRIVPQALEKLAKKHDPEAKVHLHGHTLASKSYAPRTGYTDTSRKLHSLEITPKMRASILRGQSAFADGGAISDASDSDGPSADQGWSGFLRQGARDALGATEVLGAPGSLLDLRYGSSYGLPTMDGMKSFYDRVVPTPGSQQKPVRLQFAGGGGVVRETHRRSDGGELHTYEAEKPARASGGRVEPTEGQKKAGNYAKRKISFQGLPISIETPKGAERSGRDERTGKRWSVRMPADYGYIRGTEGADGDHVDVYVGEDHESPIAFIVNQHDHRGGRFDEHKVVLGCRSERTARDLYVSGFSDGHGAARLGSMEPVSIDALKAWLRHRKKTVKPARTASIVEHALKIAAETAR